MKKLDVPAFGDLVDKALETLEGKQVAFVLVILDTDDNNVDIVANGDKESVVNLLQGAVKVLDNGPT